MHASTRNLVTCSWPGCPQPEAVTVPHLIPEETARLAADGQLYIVREAHTVEIGFCSGHQPDVSAVP